MSRTTLRIAFAAVLLFVTSLPTQAQLLPPSTSVASRPSQTAAALTWARTYGNATHTFEGARMVKAPDGGYVIAGSTYLSGTFQGGTWLAKLDVDGQLVWQRALVKDPSAGYPAGFRATPDGGYILVGSIYGPGNQDVWAVKFDGVGTVTWQHQYDYQGGFDSARDVAALDDGFLIVGTTGATYDASNGNALLLRLDNTGNIVWKRALEEPYRRLEPDRVISLGNAGYVISGVSRITQGSVGLGGWVWIARIDATGTTVWEKRYNVGGVAARAWNMLATSDGGYMLLSSLEDGTTQSAALIKLDAQGDIVWQKKLTTLTGDNAVGGLIQLNDGGYLILGARLVQEPTPPRRLNSTGWVAKASALGDLVWQRRYALTDTLGFESSFDDFVMTDQTGFVAIGQTNVKGLSELFMVKADANGTVGASCPWVTPYSLSSTTLTNTQSTVSLPTVVTSGTVSISNTTLTLSPTLATANTLCTGSPLLDKYVYVPAIASVK